MPFIALNRSTNERINITRLTSPRRELKAADIVCQLCGSPMVVKAGLVMRPHFAHKAKCTSDFCTHPESLNHRTGKHFLAENLPRIYGGMFDVAPMIEYPIKEVRRVADVMLCFPNGWRVAHEVQLSPITTEELEARTQDYLLAGIDLFWWLGGKADTPANRTWCHRRFGVVGKIEFEGEQNWENKRIRVLAEGGVEAALMPGKSERVRISEYSALSHNVCWCMYQDNDGVFRIHPERWIFWKLNSERREFGENGICWAAKRFMRLAFFRAHEISVTLSWSAFRADLDIIPNEITRKLYACNLKSYQDFLMRYRINKCWYWHFNNANRKLINLAKLSLKRQALTYEAICKIKEYAT